MMNNQNYLFPEKTIFKRYNGIAHIRQGNFNYLKYTTEIEEPQNWH